MSGLHRKLNTDLIARMANGWKPNKDAKPLKRQKPPRPAWTYRGNWRNIQAGRSAP